MVIHSLSFQIRKEGIIQTSLVVAIKRSKDPPTWFKLATTLEKKQPPPTNNGIAVVVSYFVYVVNQCLFHVDLLHYGN